MQARRLTASLIVSLVLALGLQAACGSPQVTAPPAEQPQPTQPPTTPPEAQQPTEEPTQEEQATQPPAAADGQALLQDRCTECHGLDRTTGESKTRDEWEQTVDRMISKGARLNEDERTALLDFLTQNYGP